MHNSLHLILASGIAADAIDRSARERRAPRLMTLRLHSRRPVRQRLLRLAR
jgi:hypothetical protein